MPYDEKIALAKIGELNQKQKALRILEHEISNITNSLQQLIDIQEQDKEANGSPKFNEKGQPVMIKVIPIDRDTLEKLSTARRTAVYDKMIVAADAVIAKTA